MKEQQFYVDIGGGTHPDYFLRQSERDERSQYIVLDPTVRTIQNKPSNLHLIKWQSDDKSELPFRSKTIRGIYMSNIFDELRTNGHTLDWSDTENIFDHGYYDSKEIDNPNRQKDLYMKVLRSSKNVLKPNGELIITEPNENIPLVLDLCLNQGFFVTKAPKIVTDSTKSLWTNWFYDIYTMLELEDGKNDAAPTELALQLSV